MKTKVLNKKNILRLVLLGLLITWMMLIFSMSGKTGEASGGLSKKITEKILTFLSFFTGDTQPKPNEEFFNRIHFLVRKAAHFSEYAVLCVFVVGFMLTFLSSVKKTYFLSVGFCVLYAMTDELHQGFVDGRSPQIKDVCIDSLGAIFGGLFMIAIFLIVCRLRKRKENYELEK